MPCNWGSVSSAIERVLTLYGSMTVPEMMAAGVPGHDNVVRGTAARMARPSKRVAPIGERRAHVSAWIYDAEGARSYPRPVYTIGHGDNKPRPKSSKNSKARRNEVARKHQTAKRTRLRQNFVFNLGGVAL
jgi:hypothetical protein